MQRKHTFMKTLTAVLTTAVMALTGHAAVSPSVIDTTRTATLTICKMKENSGAVYSTNGKEGAVPGYEGMSGITFGALKIAEISQIASGEGAGTGFTQLDPGFSALLSEAKIEVSPVGGRYLATDLSEALTLLCAQAGSPSGEQKLTDYVRSHSGTVHMNATDGQGRSVAGDLALGLYLVVEEDSSGYSEPAGIVDELVLSSSNPFLVSLPLTDPDTVETDGSWIYDVTVYPKNRTVSIPKYIVSEEDGDTLLLSEDAEIGEVVRQVLLPSAPAVTHLSDGDRSRNYAEYVITDVMEEGLSYKDVVSVSLGAYQLNPSALSELASFELLTEGSDFRVLKGEEGETLLTSENAAGVHTFRIEFLAGGLEKLNQMGQHSQVAVVFDSVLTRSAKDGSAEPNKNRPSLTVANEAGQRTKVRGNEPEVFTYRLNIKKTGVTDASKVSFGVTRNGEDLSFVKEADGVYHLFDQDLDAAEGIAGEDVIRPRADGNLQIRGLDADIYSFTERTTENGHELLKSSFLVTLFGSVPADGKLTDAVIASEGAQARIGIDKGTAGFAVDNVKSLILRTGGRGVRMLYTAGGVILLMALLIFAAGKILKASHGHS